MARLPKPWFRTDRGIWCVTISGVRHNLGPDKKAAFDRFYALMSDPQSRPVRQPVETLSLPAVVDAFLDWTHRNRAVATYGWYRDHLQAFVSANRGLSLGDLRPHHVEAWAATGSENVNTRRNRMRAVKRCFRWATRQGFVDRDPLLSLDIPSPRPRDEYVSPEEFDHLLSFVLDDRFADLLRVTYQTGCRPQESLRVERRHVDLEHARWVFPQSESKGRRMPRVVYLSDESTAITRCLIGENPSGPLFRNAKGQPWNKDSVGCAFERLQTRMGKQALSDQQVGVDEADVRAMVSTLRPTRNVRGRTVKKSAADLRTEARRKLTGRLARDHAKRYSLYVLRHSWATNALRSGIDALTVAILMGHKDPSTLARTYQHLSHNPDHLLAQARRVTASGA